MGGRGKLRQVVADILLGQQRQALELSQASDLGDITNAGLCPGASVVGHVQPAMLEQCLQLLALDALQGVLIEPLVGVVLGEMPQHSAATDTFIGRKRQATKDRALQAHALPPLRTPRARAIRIVQSPRPRTFAGSRLTSDATTSRSSSCQ